MIPIPVNAESINEIFIRMNYDKINSFDKIKSPTSIDSIAYVKNLAYISYNYCDSTTVSYHRDIVERIYNIYPAIKHRISPSDDIFIELLSGLINIYNSEDEPLSDDKSCLVKLHYIVFDLSNTVYQHLNDEEKGLCLSMIIASYLDEGSRADIVNNWVNYIKSISSSAQFSSSAHLFHSLSSYLSSNGEQNAALGIEIALNNKCAIFFGNSSNEWLDCLSYTSIIYFNSNQYEKAKYALEQVINGKKLLNIPDKNLVSILRNMRHCLFTMGCYKEATSYAYRVLDTYDSKIGVEYINDLGGLAYCKFYAGEKDEAIQILKEKISYEQSFIPQNLITSYSNLSTLYRLNGDMTNSMEYGTLSVEEWEKTAIEDYDNTFSAYASLINMGAAYYILNDIQSSMAVLKKAAILHKKLTTIRRFDKQRTESDIIFWSILARDYIISNHPDDGGIALNKALDLAKDFYGERNVRYLKIYSILADLKLISGDPLGAKNVYSDILKLIDSGSNDYYSYLSGYADYCLALNLYEEAFDAINNACHGHLTTRNLITLSRCEFYTERYDKMREHLVQIFERNAKEVNRSFLTYNDIQRRSFWDDPYVGSWFQEELPALLLNTSTQDSLLMRTLYDATIFSKGILLSTETDIINSLRNSEDETITGMYNQFIELKNRIDNSNEFIDYSVLNKQAKLESILMQYIRKNNKSISALDIKSKDIQGAMHSNSIAIEFLNFHTDSTATEQYCALILEPNPEIEPKFIKLFDSNQLEAVDPNRYFNSQELSDLIWKPLDEYVNNYDVIYFSPAGELNNIPIEYLPIKTNGKYLSECKDIIRLSNTREILNKQPIRNIQDICLFGGMIYDSHVNSVDFASEAQSMQQIGTSNDIPESIRKGHAYLPSSKVEVELIDSIMKQKRIRHYLKIGVDGTEDALKTISRNKSPQILHIATHGIYFSKEDILYNPLYADYSFIKMSDHNNVYTEDLSMTQSVLLFSGADAAFKNDSITSVFNDGILTAYEISLLDLSCTDLVVLSACQTGLGEIKGDGVFGLQRGFKKAGAQTLMMSLWDVDDKATQKLMVKFYEYYLSGMSKRDALRAAQTEIRETPGFEDPEYWAAFILLDALN